MRRVLPLLLLVGCGSGPTEPLKASNDITTIALNPLTGEPSKANAAEAQASA